MEAAPKRGRPKKIHDGNGPHIVLTIPQVEDYPTADEGIIPIIPQRERILVGFKSSNDNKKRIFKLPFASLKNSEIIKQHQVLAKEYQAKINSVFQFNDKESYPDTQIYSFAMSITSSEECKELHLYVCDRLKELAQTVPTDMDNLTSATEIGEYWQTVTSKINLVSTSWSPLCLKEEQLPDFQFKFHDYLAEVFESSEELFTRLSKIIVDAYSDARENRDISSIIYAFRFAYKNVLFDRVFMPMLIDSIKNYLAPILDELFVRPLSEYLEKAVELKEEEKSLIKQLISFNALSRLENDLNMLIFGHKERFEKICNGLAPLIQQKDSKSVKICAEFARSTDTINQFTRELSFEFEAESEKCFQNENPIKAILKLHLSLADFDNSFHVKHSRVLRTAFEKGFNTSPDTAARLLAEEVHKEFIRPENSQKDTIDQLVAVFRMLASKDVFGVVHHLLLSRRVLMMKSHIVKSDEYFLAALREQCGPEYTKRFDAVFTDLNLSLMTFDKFAHDKKPPAYFKALVMARDSWADHEPEILIPPDTEIQNLLLMYTQYFSQVNDKRKLEWDFRFTRVKLSVRNLPGIKEIRCSGVVAVFLLMFNAQRVLSADDLKKRGQFTQQTIEDVIKLLRRKQCGRLILTMHNKIRINKEAICTGKNQILSIPFIFPTIPFIDNDKQKSAILSNREQQVDAAVMRVMKNERSMEKSELKVTVKDLLNFRLEDELYEKRLASLSKTLYLKLDPSGRVHYLP